MNKTFPRSSTRFVVCLLIAFFLGGVGHKYGLHVIFISPVQGLLIKLSPHVKAQVSGANFVQNAGVANSNKEINDPNLLVPPHYRTSITIGAIAGRLHFHGLSPAGSKVAKRTV